MPIEIRTPRGPYTLALAKEPQILPAETVLTLSLERRDGVEKVTLQCRVATELEASRDPEVLLARLAHWIERDFDMTREYALKSIRGEGRLMELVFNPSNRGPF